jgi:hypothetical protein
VEDSLACAGATMRWTHGFIALVLVLVRGYSQAVYERGEEGANYADSLPKRVKEEKIRVCPSLASGG